MPYYLYRKRTNLKNCKESLPRKVLAHFYSSMAGKDQKLEKFSKCNLREIGVAYKCKCANALNCEAQKTYPGEYKDKQEADKPGASLASENRPDTFLRKTLSVADKVLRVLREGKKRVFDMGKVSHSFQDYL